MSRFKKLLIALAITAVGLGVAAFNAPKTQALSGSEFNPGRIIDDSVFFNKDAMSVTDIQNFIYSKSGNCDTYHATGNSNYQPPWTCLYQYRENTSTHENNIGNPGANPAGSKTAAQIIYDAAQAYSISPKVLLVLLQKEQSLLTDNWPYPSQYRGATGYGCPDTAPCDSEYYGFYNQVTKAAYQYRRYATYPDQYNFKAGRNNNIGYNPNAACGYQTVYIQNQATAGLYNYTPYVPNAAALNNLYGTGDGCSAYGNRNFWRLWNDWFGSTMNNRAWNGEILDGSTGSIAASTSDRGASSTAVQLGEILHVFYYDQTNGNLRHATYSTAAGWNFENLDGDPGSIAGFNADVGRSPEVTVLGDAIHLIYYDQTNGNLRHAWYSVAAGWNFENLDGDVSAVSATAADVGSSSAITAYNNQLQLYYYDQTNGNLRHAWYSVAAGWRFENLDGDPGSIARKDANLGLSPNVVVYNNQLQLYYYDQTNGNLRHAWTDSSGWRFENLDGDPGSILGNSSDLGLSPTAIVNNSLLRLFYYDTTNKILRHAWPN